MLSSPSHAVVGCTDLKATERFLAHFGFEGEPGTELPATAAAALYGLEAPTAQRILRTPGAEAGWVRLIETPHGERHGGPYDARPIAIDLYTRDIEKSVEISRQAGAEIRDLVEYALGPLEVKEIEVIGPDHLVVVFIEVSQLRASVLDKNPDLLHSEVHSIVFSVQDTDVALPFWSMTAGLETLTDAKIEGPIISQLMALPRENVPVRFTLMCDADSAPARFELLEFFDDPGEEQPTMPLAGGLHAAGFAVADLDAAMAGLKGADFSAVVQVGDERAVSALAPGGVRFELWQADA